MNRHVAKLNFGHDPNLGLYGIATDKFCIVGRTLTPEIKKELAEVLKVPIIEASVYGTNLIGVFIAANSRVVLVPAVAYDEEIAHLTLELKKLDVKVHIIHSEMTALGNTMLLNDSVGIINTDYPAHIAKEIERAAGIKVMQMDIAGLNLPGSMGFITNKGGIFSPNISDKEIKSVEKLLNFEIGLGTINMGSSFVSSGLIGNSFGFVIGGMSSGYEITRADESLGFLR